MCFEQTVTVVVGSGVGRGDQLLKNVLFFLCKDKMMKNYNDSNKNNDIINVTLESICNT